MVGIIWITKTVFASMNNYGCTPEKPAWFISYSQGIYIITHDADEENEKEYEFFLVFSFSNSHS